MTADILGTAVTFARDKEAALYFDHVVPLLCNDFWGSGGIDAAFFDVVPEILPPGLLAKLSDHYFSDNCPDDEVSKQINRAAYGDRAGVFQIMLKFHILLASELDRFVGSLVWFLSKFDLVSMPILFSEGELSHAGTDTGATDAATTVLTLADLPLIDCTQAGWDQILEIRKDDVSHKKLRRLRLFLSQNYSGKSRSFIQDDLAQRLEDYEDTIREWGFKTRTACISALLNSKTLIATSSAALASILLGEPLVATGAALTGSAIEIGKLSLEIAKSNQQLEKLRREHPLDYVLHAREKLGIKAVDA